MRIILQNHRVQIGEVVVGLQLDVTVYLTSVGGGWRGSLMVRGLIVLLEVLKPYQ